MSTNRYGTAVLIGLGTIGLVCGCVERTARIRTNPPGALIVVNDEEVGVSPVKFSFQWYGDYDIIARKPGYETLKTHHQINAPWYENPPFDFFAELLIPNMITDHREFPEFALTPAVEPAPADVVERAVEMRDRTLFQQGDKVTK
jgi:hypothetical protein